MRDSFSLFPSQTIEHYVGIATTPAGLSQLQALCLETLAIWVPSALGDQLPGKGGIHVYTGRLREQLTILWPQTQGFIFALASGATVRLVAPLLQDKATDPAIVVIEETGQFVISLCGGHQGGADVLTRAIAARLGAQAVLSGAASAQGLPGIDVLGRPFGWRQGTGNWLGVSGAIARQGTVEVIQEAGSRLWQQHLPPGHPFQFCKTEGPPADKTAQARLWISAIQRPLGEGDRERCAAAVPEAQWHPRVLWIGIGCERGSSRRLIEQALSQALAVGPWSDGAIAGIATLDIKADEAGLLELCQDRGWPLRCFSPEALRSIEVPTPSPIVEREVGTPSVAEAAAIAAASSLPFVSSGESSSEKHGIAPLLLPKQITRQAGEPGAVTLAIAQAFEDYTGRNGHLSLVGTGPGALDQITPAAKAAIVSADAIVGYGLYIDLIRPLLRPGQIVEAMPITQERARADRAIALAHWGLTVAVISSGDSGIYGMAGLVMERLHQQGWDGTAPSLEVLPGITALQAAAARVGTPLMHDFCAISLSDLLTPWAVIEQRLKAAAAADFVVALYNPKSQTRVTQLAAAQQCFLAHRNVNTPVALVRSAYRETEQIQLTTLGALDPAAVDMLTLVLIGNASTLRHGDYLITPRGYLGFGDHPSVP